MMELRKCCVHPYLLTGGEEKATLDAKATTQQDVFECMVSASGKLVLLDKLLPRLKQNGHRVLIFSQMTRCLDILSDYLRGRGYLHERIDGGVRGDARQAAIARFSAADSDIFCFLLCTRAGGVGTFIIFVNVCLRIGINLTAADTCVIFDSDWNPQNDLQAQARCTFNS
jgi:SNF2 family DNA or RNA helicase